jgi:hypothetical protein
MTGRPEVPLDEAAKQRLRKLRDDSRALLDMFADRLTEQEVTWSREFSDVGEWALLVDGICAYLVKGEIPVTPAERDAIAAVLAQFHDPRPVYEYLAYPDGTLAALIVTG